MIYTPEIFKERSAALSQKLADIEQNIIAEESEIKEIENNVALHNDFIPHFEAVLAVYRTTEDIAEKNRLLKSLVRHVTYTKSVRNNRKNPDESNFGLIVEPIVK